MERGGALPRGGVGGAATGDRADEISIGRVERTSRVDCCDCDDTGPARSALLEGDVLPLEDHCLNPSTELEWEKRESWSGSWKRAWLRSVSVRKYGSGT